MSQSIVGVHKVLFIRLKYPDDNEIVLSAQKAQAHTDNLKAIFRANSYETVDLDFDITPVLLMPQPITFYQVENRLSFVRLRADALKVAEDAGFPESAYDREIIFTKKVWPQEKFRGVGGINNRTVYTTFDNAAHSSHELGHSLDFRHANFWRVSSSNPIDTAGVEIEYGDKFDMMGDVFNFHHYNPWYKSRLGWLPPESILTVAESGTYIIRALEKTPQSGSSVSQYSALRIRRDSRTDYWVYYRSREDSARAGAMITRVAPRNTSRAVLLDMTPGSKPEKKDHIDAALIPGKTIQDQEAGIEITVLEKYSDSLRVQVVVSQNPIDILPVIDIVNPVRGKTVLGVVDYEATAFDPDVGNVNGAGIDTVKFALGYPEGDDPFGEGTVLRMVAAKDVTSPPYVFRVDTDGVPDESYRLFVRAIGQNGESNTVTLNHIIDNTGPSIATAVDEKPAAVSRTFQLQANFPNPFSRSTTIHYSLAQAGIVTLNVYDLLGRRVRSLVTENQHAGEYSAQWNGRDEAGRPVASGSYFFELRVGGYLATKKMLLLR